MRNYLIKLLEPKENGPEIGISLVRLLNVKVTRTTLTKEIEEHPAYPSLLSISDVLKSHGVDNIGIRFPADKFTDLPVPFITQLKGLKNPINFFTVVREIDKEITYFYDPEKHGWASISNKEFLKRCSGVALISEVGDDAGEKNYDKIVRQEKRREIIQYLSALCVPVILGLAGFLAFLQHGLGAFLPTMLLAITLAGGIVTVLLLWYELDQFNPLLKQICNTGKRVNCSALLHSKAAKIMGVSWTYIGFSYFAGFLMLELFWGINAIHTLFAVSWLNTLAIPYVVFSVYYQWRVAKQWCALCLFVQVLLVLQFVCALVGGWHVLMEINHVTPILILRTITAFTLPFLAVTLVLPILQRAKEGKRFYTQLQRIKRNPQVFDALLQKQKALTESSTGLGITIGNPDASYKLIKVCNPYCIPCANAHRPMEELLHNNSDIQLQILFTATSEQNDIKALPVRHLLAIAENSNEVTVKQALDDWYLSEKRDYETFAVKYPLGVELIQQTGKIEAMQKWCKEVKVDFTPTFFVSLPREQNGELARYYQLPDIYTVSDLQYFLSI